MGNRNCTCAVTIVLMLCYDPTDVCSEQAVMESHGVGATVRDPPSRFRNFDAPAGSLHKTCVFQSLRLAPGGSREKCNELSNECPCHMFWAFCACLGLLGCALSS